MEHTTAIGPEDASPADRRETRATTEGVDAQNANEFDIEHGLAGIEVKPFSPAAPGTPKTSQAQNDAGNKDRQAQSGGLVSERRNPGRDDGVNASTVDGGASEE
ncbi:hypothetical protein WG901_08635 [Novosphingobium sp. PS1R-30]|uniref:Uncharacterized protein n=1 Tax=Novosphingobium anseongense TaxID=3133436 RepID=A0ABU8RUQ8_9SPHN